MTPSLRLEYTNIRYALVDGQAQVELQHVSKDAAGERHKTEWVHMPAADARALVAKLVTVLDGMQALGNEHGNG